MVGCPLSVGAERLARPTAKWPGRARPPQSATVPRGTKWSVLRLSRVLCFLYSGLRGSSIIRAGPPKSQNVLALSGAPGRPRVTFPEARGPQDGPRWPQHAPKRAQEASKMAQERSKTPEMAPRLPKRPPRGPKRPPRGPKTPPRGLQDAQIVDFHCAFHCFWGSRLFALPTLQD